MVRVILLDHADKSFAAERIDTLSLHVEIDIVARSAYWNSGNFPTIVGIQDHYERRSASDDEEPMIVLVECHGVVRFGAVEPPFGQFAGFPVDDIDHAVIVRNVYENARSLLFQLERLGVTTTAL